jgi:hypothetical protein
MSALDVDGGGRRAAVNPPFVAVPAKESRDPGAPRPAWLGHPGHVRRRPPVRAHLGTVAVMSPDAARPSRDDPALLFAVKELAEVMLAAFEVAGVRSVVEIGADGGLSTAALLEWVTARDGRLVTVDPGVSAEVRRLGSSSPLLSVIESTSESALAGLPAHDAYVLDGDHNYATVTAEIGAIVATAAAAGRHPVLAVADVGWPCGTRDLYYDPERLPPDAVHPYDFGGVVPWSKETVTGGFRGEGHFAFATVEGGPRNGVRTALDDFLAGHEGWEVASIPSVFGLALVWPTAAPWAGAVRVAVGGFDDHPVLARLEANRILLYLRLIEAQDELARERHRAAERIHDLEAHLDAARSELAVRDQALRAAEVAPGR